MSRVELGYRKRALCIAALVTAAAPVVVLAEIDGVSAVPTNQGVIRGVIGVEGGAYPGTLRPTSGTVEFTKGSVDRTINVGMSGHFSISLNPGKWTATACGGTNNSQCGPAKVINVTQDHTNHVKLPWLLAP